MTTLSLRRRLSYRILICARSFSRLGHTSPASRGSDSDGENADEEPRIPMVPKRRDPNAVLKALQSTVGPVKHPMVMEGRSWADPLSPISGRLPHMEFVRMKEAGRAAARYVIDKWPAMFPHLQQEDYKPKGKSSSEERLRWLVSERRTEESLKLYKHLRQIGKVVSLEVMNELLALAAYEGTGNQKAGAHDVAQKKINWPRKDPPSPNQRGKQTEMNEKFSEQLREMEEEMTEIMDSQAQSENDARRYTSSKTDGSDDSESAGFVLVWSPDNVAEKMFAEMENKDGASYDAMIQGLVKHKNYRRAFNLFSEMRKQKLQASLGTYNMLLGALLDQDKPKHTMMHAKLMVTEMTSDPVVQPDITTMNHILSFCLMTKSSARQLASETMREIVHLGLEPTLTTFTRLLKAFTQSGEGQVLYEIVDYLEQHPQVLLPHSEHDLSFFLEASYVARIMGDVDLATRLKQLAAKDHYFLVDNINFFLSHYLVTVATYGDFERLKQECADLIPNTVRPYEWVYGLIFRACERAQSPEFGLHIWRGIIKYWVPIFNRETIERFCGAISSRIDPSDALRYISALERAWSIVENQNMRPPGFLISQTIRLHVLNNDLEKAWHYYGYFEKYQYPPMFLALTVLLRAHHAIGDAKKMVEIMDILIERESVLPLQFIKKLCFTSGIDIATRNRIIKGFSENMKNKQIDNHQTY